MPTKAELEAQLAAMQATLEALAATDTAPAAQAAEPIVGKYQPEQFAVGTGTPPEPGQVITLVSASGEQKLVEVIQVVDLTLVGRSPRNGTWNATYKRHKAKA